MLVLLPAAIDATAAAGRLGREAKVAFLDDLVRAGSALWFDRTQRSALVLWRSVPDWADAIYRWARACGFEDSVVTVEEMQVGGHGCACAGGVRMCEAGEMSRRWLDAPSLPATVSTPHPTASLPFPAARRGAAADGGVRGGHGAGGPAP